MRVLLCQHVVWANKQERRQRKVTAPGRHPSKWYPQGRTRFPISKISSNLKIVPSLTPTKNFPMLCHYFQKGVPVLSIQPTAIMGATHRMSSGGSHSLCLAPIPGRENTCWVFRMPSFLFLPVLVHAVPSTSKLLLSTSPFS